MESTRIDKGILLVGVCLLAVTLLSIGTMIYVAITDGKKMKQIIDTKAVENVTLVGFGGNILDDKERAIAYYSPTFKIEWDTEAASRYVNKLDSIYNVYAANYNSAVSSHKEDKIAMYYVSMKYVDSLRTLHSPDMLIKNLDKFFKDKNNGKSFANVVNTAFKKKSHGNKIMDKCSFDDIKIITSKGFPFFSIDKNKGGLVYSENYRVDFINNGILGRLIGQNNLAETKSQGLLHVYQHELMGETKVYQKIRTKKSYKPLKTGEDFLPADGRNIFTTLNYEISEISYNALLKKMQSSDANRGCVIVLEVATGNIKAMVNLVRNGDKFLSSENVAIKDVYEPGSVFKLASFMAAMNDNLINWNKPYEVGSDVKKTVGPRAIWDSHRPHKSSLLPKEIFEESSNIGTCMMIWDLYSSRQQKYIDALRKMHIGENTDIEILGEGKAFLKDTKTTIKHKEWWNVSLLQIAYGYEVELTPLQMATFYNAIANNGIYVKPRITAEISANKLFPAEFLPVKIVDTICTQEIAAKAKEILVAAAHEGTGKSVFKNAPYTFAGKTGTAQYNTKGKTAGHRASFAGFFPADSTSTPLYTIYVYVSEPREGGYYAATVAAPIAREIADKIFELDKRFYKNIIINANTPKVTKILNNLNNDK